MKFSGLSRGETLQVTDKYVKRKYITDEFAGVPYPYDLTRSSKGESLNETNNLYFVELPDDRVPGYQFVVGQLSALVADVCPIIVEKKEVESGGQKSYEYKYHSIHAKSIPIPEKTRSEALQEKVLLVCLFKAYDISVEGEDSPADKHTGEYHNYSHGRFFDFEKAAEVLRGGATGLKEYWGTYDGQVKKIEDFTEKYNLTSYQLLEIENSAVQYRDFLKSEDGKKFFEAIVLKSGINDKKFIESTQQILKALIDRADNLINALRDRRNKSK